MTNDKPTFREFKQTVLRPDAVFSERYLGRPLSTRITWLILRFCPSITPNQASGLAFLVGLLGITILFFATNYVIAIAGAIVFYLWSILDGVDGEIARFKRKTSHAGHYLDISLDPIIISLGLLSFTCFIFRMTADTLLLLIGLCDAIFFWIHRNGLTSFVVTFKRINPAGNDIPGVERTLMGSDSRNPPLWKRVAFYRLDRKLTFGLNFALMVIASLCLDSFVGWRVQIQLMWLLVTFSSVSLVLFLYLLMIPYSIAGIASAFVLLKRIELEASAHDSKDLARQDLGITRSKTVDQNDDELAGPARKA